MKKLLLFVAGLMLAMSASAEWYVAGNGAAGNPWCDGKTWDAAGSLMVDNTITFKDVPAGTYEFKVTSGNWKNDQNPDAINLNVYDVDSENSTPGYEGEDNIKFTIASTADITISVSAENKITLKSTVAFENLVVTSWTIAGVADLMGEGWNPASDANVMTEISAGVFELVKKEVVLAAASYDYKACANKAWSIKEIPSSGNQTLVIDADGTYDVTFTLYAGQMSLEAVATLSTSTGIEDIAADDEVVAAFDITGKPVAADAKGIVILQYKSGKAAKVINY